MDLLRRGDHSKCINRECLVQLPGSAVDALFPIGEVEVYWGPSSVGGEGRLIRYLKMPNCLVLTSDLGTRGLYLRLGCRAFLM